MAIIFSNYGYLKAQFCDHSLNPGYVVTNNSPNFPVRFEGKLTIKLYYHIVRSVSGLNGVPDSYVDASYRILTEAYAPHNIFFFKECHINYINYLPENQSYISNLAMQQNYHTDGIDIFLFPEVAPGIEPGWGLALPPFLSSVAVIGRWFQDQTYPGLSNIISHEVGHVLSLFHTHNGTWVNEPFGMGIPELVERTNCTSAGDLCCDTPADPGLRRNGISYVSFPGCNYVNDGSTDANGILYTPNTNNIMSYSWPQCLSSFSTEQEDRMRVALMANSLWLSPITITSDFKFELVECNYINFEPTDVNPSYTYFWDFGDGSNSNLPVVSHLYDIPGNYTVKLTVEGECGNFSYSIQKIEIAPFPALTFEITNNCPSFTFSVQNPQENFTYSWIFSDGINSDGPTTNRIFTTNGMYSVTLKATNSCEQITNTAQNVNVDCYSGIFSCTNTNLGISLVNEGAIVNISNFFPVTNSVTDGNFIIDGTLIIDKNFTFRNCHLLMKPGAEIVKGVNIELSIVSNSIIEGCDKMWKGIKLLSGNRINVSNSKIKDAEYAINLSNSNILNLKNVGFENNFIGIYSDVGMKTITVQSFAGNLFSNPINLKPRYDNQIGYPESGAKAFAGVFVNDIYNFNLTATSLPPLIGGVKNVFFEINNGIISSNTGITSVGNEFNLNKASGFPSGASGSGYSVSQLLKVKGVATLAHKSFFANFNNNKIVHSDHGFLAIYCNLSSVNANNNIIDASDNLSKNGIKTYLSNNSSFVFNSNSLIQNYQNGVEIVSNLNPVKISVNNNSIKNTFSGTFSAISIGDIKGRGPFSIQQNIISSGVAGDYLRLSNTGNFLVEDNQIELLSGNLDKKGLRMSSTFSNQIRNNTVIDQSNNNNSTGIYVDGANNDLFCCNDINQSFLGFRFEGINSISERFSSNIMSNNGLGLYIYHGSTGQQTNKGNIWRGPNNAAKLEQGIGSTGTLDSRFFVNQNQTEPGGGTFLPVLGQENWFFGSEILASTCLTQSDCGILTYEPTIVNSNEMLYPQLNLLTSSELTEMIQIAQGNVLDNEYYQQNKWKAQYDLLKRLKTQEKLRSFSPVLLSFYNQNINSILGEFLELDERYEHLFELSLIEKQSVSTAQTLLVQNDKAIENMKADALTDEDFDSVFPLIDVKNQNIVSSAVQLQLMDQMVTQRTLSDALTMIDALGAINTSVPFLVKKIKVMTEKLEYLVYGDERFSYADRMELENIANGCYLSDGDAVHAAQDFLAIFNENINWKNLCIPTVNPRIKQNKERTDIKIYPNPVSDILNVDVGSFEIINMSISDITGRAINKFTKISENDNIVKIDISTFKSGIYFINIELNNEPNKIFKFIKIQ